MRITSVDFSNVNRWPVVVLCLFLYAPANELKAEQRDSNTPAESGSTQANSSDKAAPDLLHWAALRGHPDKIEAILLEGVDVNARVDKGTTALHLAAYAGRTRTIQTLIRLGAEVNARDDEGLTALDWSRYNKHAEAEALLLGLGAERGRLSASGDPRNPAAFIYARSGKYIGPPADDIQPDSSVRGTPIPQQNTNDVVEVTQEVPAQPDIEQAAREPAVESEPVQSDKETAPSTGNVQEQGETRPVDNSHRVQLGAFSKSENASRFRAQLLDSHASLLGDTDLVVEPRQYSTRTLYCVRSRFMGNMDAESLCEQLKQREQDCIVVRP